MNELDQLDGLAASADEGAAAIDNPQAPEGAAAPAEAGPDYAGEAAGAVDMFAAMVVGFAPKAEPVWSEAARRRTAAALAPVMEKYGISFGALPPELTLVIVAGPLLWQSSKIVAAQMEAEKAIAKAKTPAPAPSGIAKAAAAPAEQAPGPARHPQEALYPA